MIYDRSKNKLSLNDTNALTLILKNRGFNEESIKEFIRSDFSDTQNPFEFSNVKAICDKINQVISEKGSVLIYGDYDCDGVCAVSILYNYFIEKQISCSYFIPLRSEGYGLNTERIKKIKKEINPSLIITVDCGISATAQVEECKKEGIDIIITDHHEPPEKLPDTLIFNPKTDRNKGLFCEYCGAGVVFKLIEALEGKEYSEKFADIAAIATIGDIVPLKGENRNIVRCGLDIINKREKAVYKIFYDKLNLKKNFSSADIAFKIVPRINAAGRLADASKTVELFISDDYFILSCLVDELNELNSKRQSLCDKTYKEAKLKLKEIGNNENIIILSDKNWDPGVLGIAAARLCDEYFKPVILFSEKEGKLKGSVRSVKGLNIYKFLEEFTNCFISFGGHESAAGITMKKEFFEEFKEKAIQSISEYPEKLFIPVIEYEAFVLPENINLNLVKALESLEPCGAENEKPLLMLKNSDYNFLQIGKTSHIKSMFKNFEVVGFSNISLMLKSKYSSEINIFGNLTLNEFNNKIIPNFSITDYCCEYSENMPGLLGNITYRAQYINSALEYFGGKSKLTDGGKDNNKFLNSCSKIEKMKAESLSDYINNFKKHSVKGRVFITYNPENYKKLNSLLNVCSDCVNIIETDIFNFYKVSSNLILYAADPFVDLSEFNEIIFLESPLNDAIIKNMNINGKAKIIDFGMSENNENIEISYEDVGKIYKSVKELTVSYGGKYNSILQLAISLSEKEEDLFYKNMISLYILEELGVLQKDSEGKYIVVEKKNPIENSEIYKYFKKTTN